MQLTFLGTGTSQGVPIIGCKCEVCQSQDPHNKRLRTSAWVHTPETDIVIDAGPDFRYQCLRADIDNVDAILLTHEHRDHVGGLDDVRPFNYYQKHPMPLYGNAATLEGVRASTPYAFAENRYPGAPEFEMHETVSGQTFRVHELNITPIEILHYRLKINAYRIGDFTYITDAKEIPPESIDLIRGTRTLVVNALRLEPHLAHFSLQDALDFIEEIKPEEAYLTHIGHTLDHDATTRLLPPNVHMAYDGLTVEL